MKKFYFFLVAMVLGVVSANATVQFFGSIDGGAWTPADLTNGSYEFTVTKTTYFTFTTDGAWGGAWRPTNQGDWTVKENGEISALPSGSNGCFIISIPGTYTVTPNEANTSFTITGFSGEVVEDKLQFFGNIDDAGWEAFDLDDKGSYVLTFTKSVYFTFTTDVWAGAWRPVDGTEDCIVTPGVTIEAQVGGNQKCFTIETPGTYTLTPNEADHTFVMTAGTTAVEGIEIEENVAPVYYNLQGVRVDAPANGLYIVVRGDKVAKEIVK